MHKAHEIDVINSSAFYSRRGLTLTRAFLFLILTVFLLLFISVKHFSIHSKQSVLKPRSTHPGVIVIGSSNIHICRNHLWNPDSEIIHSKQSVLKPRSTHPGVIVIGSSNIHICRNHLWNPDSEM
ncbi:unnamed protein product [Trichobilharzia regenti]|nr:unnamed protein product [Trichobilharzia regenti]